MARLRFVTTFVVEGKRPFPIDMLRYDCAYPKSSTDASAIERTFTDPYGERVTVTLRHKHFAKDDVPIPTVGRWESFGYTVKSRTIEQY